MKESNENPHLFSFLKGLAKKAVNHTRARILKGSSCIENNDLSGNYFTYLDNGVSFLRKSREPQCNDTQILQHIFTLDKNHDVYRYEELINSIGKYSLGNCYEFAVFAADYMLRELAKIARKKEQLEKLLPIEEGERKTKITQKINKFTKIIDNVKINLFSIINGDHTFLILMDKSTPSPILSGYDLELSSREEMFKKAKVERNKIYLANERSAVYYCIKLPNGTIHSGQVGLPFIKIKSIENFIKNKSLITKLIIKKINSFSYSIFGSNDMICDPWSSDPKRRVYPAIKYKEKLLNFQREPLKNTVRKLSDRQGLGRSRTRDLGISQFKLDYFLKNRNTNDLKTSFLEKGQKIIEVLQFYVHKLKKEENKIRDKYYFFTKSEHQLILKKKRREVQEKIAILSEQMDWIDKSKFCNLEYRNLRIGLVHILKNAVYSMHFTYMEKNLLSTPPPLNLLHQIMECWSDKTDLDKNLGTKKNLTQLTEDVRIWLKEDVRPNR